MNKTEFVRSHPNLKAGELVKLAAKKKVKLTTAHIHSIRWQLRQNGATKFVKAVVKMGVVDGAHRVRAARKVPTLSSRVEAASKKFVNELLAEVRRASIADFA